jgi:hypothetical protein
MHGNYECLGIDRKLSWLIMRLLYQLCWIYGYKSSDYEVYGVLGCVVRRKPDVSEETHIHFKGHGSGSACPPTSFFFAWIVFQQ